MSFKTASAILRGIWLIEPGYAKAHLPFVLTMINGDNATQEKAAISFQEKMQAKTALSLPERRSFAGMYTTAGSTPTDVFRVSPYTSLDRLPYNSIVVVNIIGPILKYGDYCDFGTVEYNDLLIKLANSNRVSGIIINFDTPGGQAAGTAMFAQTIKEVSLVKPVLGICQDGIVASAGMWLASACQEFYVTQATDQVGSIGAYQTIADFSEAYQMMGIKLHEIYAPQSVDKNIDYRNALAGDYALVEADLKFLVQDFINTVKTNRGGRLNTTLENPFTGKMYNAKEAKAIGLIDGIKPLSAVVKRMEQLIALRA